MELNEIKDLIKKAKRNNVATLDLSSRGLTSLPPEISELKNLTELYIFINKLTSLPPEISELKKLNELDVSNNKLTSLPPEISELKNLTQLNLSGNQLTSLPPEFSELINLAILSISENQLTLIPPEISELINLTELYMSQNQLTSLPPEILKLGLKIQWGKNWKQNIVCLEDNPFENPPVEIVKKGIEAVINYFKSLEDGKEPLNEVKVLLVGDGGAGKTSLVKGSLGKKLMVMSHRLKEST